MPLPKTKDMGTMMDFLKHDKPGMPHKQMVAIALHQTGKGRAGAKISKMASKVKRA